MSRIDETKQFIPVRIAVLTVSDSRSLAEDRSGDTLVQRLTEAGHDLAARAICTDDRDKIAAQLRAWVADSEIDVILSTGGTGLTGATAAYMDDAEIRRLRLAVEIAYQSRAWSDDAATHA